MPAAKRGPGRPRKSVPPPPPPASPLLKAGATLPADPVDASLALMRQQLEACTKTSEAANIGRAIAALSAESRKREDSLVRRQQRSTLPEDVELTKEMIEHDWPIMQRRQLRDWLLKLEPLEAR